MIWSSIHPDPGVWSSGWFRKNTKRPPGSRTRATSASAASTSSMCSKTRQATTASKLPSATGRPIGVGPGVDGSARSLGRGLATWVAEGSNPDHRRRRRPAIRRATWPSPHPTSSTRSAPARCCSASGRICSSYSASTPSVKPSCHHRGVALPVGPALAASGAAPLTSGRFLVHGLVDGDRHVVGQPGQCLQILQVGRLHRSDTTQLLHQALLRVWVPTRRCRPTPTSSCVCCAAAGDR